MLNVGVLTLLSIVSGVGIVGNLFIIGSICIYRKLRVRGHAFIANLAVADLIIVAYIMPVGLATSQFPENPFSETMCEINAFLISTSCGLSTQSLMLVALERYVHICRMNLYRKLFTSKLIAVYIALTWVYTVVWTAQGWTGWTKYIYGVNIYLCVFSGKASLSYDICIAFFGMVLPMIVLGVCYYNIFRKVVASRRAMNAHRKAASRPGTAESLQLYQPEVEKQAAREYRLVVMLFAIVVIYSVCWIPASIALVGSGVWKNMPPDTSSGNRSHSGSKQGQSLGRAQIFSDSSRNVRSGASSATTDITTPDSDQSLISHSRCFSSPNVQPIKYDEEPLSGAPRTTPAASATTIKPNMALQVTNHDETASEGDNLSVVQVDSSPIFSDMFMSSTSSSLTQAGSQANLIRPSATDSGGNLNGYFAPGDDSVRQDGSSMRVASQSQLATQTVLGSKHTPLPDIYPTTSVSQQAAVSLSTDATSEREMSLKNVVLETKM